MTDVQLRDARAAISRVRELHQQCGCNEQAARHCVECEQLYPCSTLQALGADRLTRLRELLDGLEYEGRNSVSVEAVRGILDGDL